MTRYEVVVGNVGNVCDTDDFDKAKRTYEEYRAASENNEGRCGGEEVSLLRNGEPIAGYLPILNAISEVVDADEIVLDLRAITMSTQSEDSHAQRSV